MRLESLTSLPFHAAALVFGYHVSDELGGGARDAADAALGHGFVGVGFFFVLSGFVLTWSRSADVGAGPFFRRRAARIVPAYLVALLLAWGAGDRPGVEGLPSVFLVQAWWPDPDVHFAVLAVGWTLSCEAAFYAAYPLVAVVVARLQRFAAPLLCALVAMPLAFAAAADSLGGDPSGWLVAIFPPARFVEFLAGGVLAVLVRRGFALPRPSVAIAVATLGYAAAGAVAAGYETAVMTPVWVVLIGSLAGSDIGGRRRAPSALVFLGVVSYAFYLLHGLVIDGISRAAERGAWWEQGSLDGWAAGLFCVVALACSVGVAVALWAAVERPAERHLRGDGHP